jgi:DNA segregation ATPase FtsK/SpoIIIE-like protein
MYIQTKGAAHIYITSTKAKDYYPFQNLPNCQISQTHTEFNLMLDEITQEYNNRNALLYSPALAKATDSKGVKKLYPHMYHLFQPIFVIIDEFSRFSDNQEIQNKVTELVETAGFVNVHVIISTTRPDARTVLKPRIKANLLARICFTTADTNNSIVILDKEGAENLGRIEGRAIFLNSETNIIQVPYMSYQQCEELLQPYKKEIVNNDTPNHKEIQRPENHQLTNKIQNLFKESDSTFDIQTELEPNKCLQPHDEKIINGWFRLASETDKR